MPPRSSRALVPFLAPCVLGLLLSACSGSAPAVQEPVPTDPEPVEPAPALAPYVTLHFDAAGLTYADLYADAVTTLAPGATYGGRHTLSPNRDLVAVTYARADSVYLGLVDVEDGTLQPVHAAPAATVYSLAWAPDGAALAFGHYVEQDDARGPGGVKIVDVASGTVQDVGCETSTSVHFWLPDDPLVVGDGSNLYVVEHEDCRTLASLDARRMHHVTFSATGLRMAYIYRELVYNADARTYEPDSTLFIADVTGENAVEVAGYTYRPRHLRWSPDGTILAFDVASQDHDGVRHISLYDLETSQATYLTPPDEAGRFSDTHPAWSPAGTRLAYMQHAPGTGQPGQPMVHTFMEMLTRGLPTAPLDAPVTLWGWAGNDALVLTAPGKGTIVPLQGEPAPLPPHATLVYVGPSPSAAAP